MFAPGDLPAEQGTVNLIPVDYFVESALCILEQSGSAASITSRATIRDMTTLAEYSERFLGVRGIRVLWDPSRSNPAPNPAEELFDRFIEQYRPYLLTGESLIGVARSITPVSLPPFTYDIFERCMAYAVQCDWGRKSPFLTLVWPASGYRTHVAQFVMQPWHFRRFSFYARLLPDSVLRCQMVHHCQTKRQPG